LKTLQPWQWIAGAVSCSMTWPWQWNAGPRFFQFRPVPEKALPIASLSWRVKKMSTGVLQFNPELDSALEPKVKTKSKRQAQSQGRSEAQA